MRKLQFWSEKKIHFLRHIIAVIFWASPIRLTIKIIRIVVYYFMYTCELHAILSTQWIFYRNSFNCSFNSFFFSFVLSLLLLFRLFGISCRNSAMDEQSETIIDRFMIPRFFNSSLCVSMYFIFNSTNDLYSTEIICILWPFTWDELSVRFLCSM